LNAYKIRRNTLSRLRFSLLVYVYVHSRREIRALRVLLAFSYGIEPLNVGYDTLSRLRFLRKASTKCGYVLVILSVVDRLNVIVILSVVEESLCDSPNAFERSFGELYYTALYAKNQYFFKNFFNRA
jgi:hypothetical protein